MEEGEVSDFLEFLPDESPENTGEFEPRGNTLVTPMFGSVEHTPENMAPSQEEPVHASEPPIEQSLAGWDDDDAPAPEAEPEWPFRRRRRPRFGSYLGGSSSHYVRAHG